MDKKYERNKINSLSGAELELEFRASLIAEATMILAVLADKLDDEKIKRDVGSFLGFIHISEGIQPTSKREHIIRTLEMFEKYVKRNSSKNSKGSNNTPISEENK